MDGSLPRSTLELKITKFVMQYGAEELINYLDDFDSVIDKENHCRFRLLEKTACESCGITISDMRKLTNNQCTNAKRIISFIAHHSLKLPIATISKLLGNMADRSINYYIRDVENWLSVPKANREFIEIFNKVVEILKFE